jgi:hypothetical protein
MVRTHSLRQSLRSYRIMAQGMTEDQQETLGKCRFDKLGY